MSNGSKNPLIIWPNLLGCVRGRHLVNIPPFQFGEEATRIHPSYLLGSNMLASGEQLLEAGIVADWVPDRINF
jgi:hypothetical protein